MTAELNTCKLCGKVHSDDTYGSMWRICYIERTSSGVTHQQVARGYGYYEPRLTVDEVWKLMRGENAICTHRQDCNRRQRSKTR